MPVRALGLVCLSILAAPLACSSDEFSTGGNQTDAGASAGGAVGSTGGSTSGNGGTSGTSSGTGGAAHGGTAGQLGTGGHGVGTGGREQESGGASQGSGGASQGSGGVVSGSGGGSTAGGQAGSGGIVVCPPCSAPPGPNCIGQGPCGCGPYICPSDGGSIDAGKPCGASICLSGTTCCNPLRGVCVHPGEVCPL